MAPPAEGDTGTPGRDLAVVIGAGPGLGRSLALNFAGHGLDLVLVARNRRRLEKLAEEVETSSVTATVVVGDASDGQQLAARLGDVASLGRIQILAYNAMHSAGGLGGVSVEDLRTASEVNLHAPVLAVAALLPSLRAARGSVLITGGGLSLQPVPSLGVLSAGKAALRAAAYALAGELEPQGVKVRTVTVAGRIQPGTELDPERIAEVFWTAHMSPDGPVEVVLGG